MTILGLMSGTSLDGLDMCMVEFNRKNNWKILRAVTKNYPPGFKESILNLMHSDAAELAEANFKFTKFMAVLVNDFLSKNKLKPDYISFPGQTLFHQPQKGFTFQLGLGSVLASLTNTPVVWDFRTSDIALGGQGAPLVPCGEFELWKGYDIFLNLGGIANFSFKKNGKIWGSDICPCNMALNDIANKAGKKFDRGGILASGAEPNFKLVGKLIRSFYEHSHALGYEDYLQKWKKYLNTEKMEPNSLLSTITEAIAECIVAKIKKYKPKKIMVTGGGTWNTELVKRLKQKYPQSNWVVPHADVVNYKEAVVFAFLAYKRIRNQKNVLSSVTGSKYNHITGCISLP
ncbi:MAG: anhydro-N-acetylmuramic acid kinase [Bacteroidia bacterium]|nr:anhydro-N-acetylmuramic acid kinase [Bacteroidia bacterium]